jgi:hypothetical protein
VTIRLNDERISYFMKWIAGFFNEIQIGAKIGAKKERTN